MAVTENVWWVELESETSDELNDPQLGLASYSNVEGIVSYSHLTSGKEIKVYGSVYDQDFTSDGTGIGLNESPNIPVDFHDALTHFVIMKGYELKPDMVQLASYQQNKWNMDISEGREYSNTSLQGSTPAIIPYDF